MDELLQRLLIRLPDTQLTNEQLTEYLQTMSDRLCLRLGVETLPAIFESICVDATVKMVLRGRHPGRVRGGDWRLEECPG